MKKNRVRLIVLIVLVIAAIYLVSSQSKSSFKKELRDFAIEDTATVDKIFLVDKANKQILLERKPTYWELNGEFVARQDLVDLLLKTMSRLKVKEPVSNSGLKTVIKNLAVKSTKVEFYQKGKLTKTIYVGGPTKDSHGTYMMLENSSRPFVVDMPGFRGYLSTRFPTVEYEWKAQTAFNFGLETIEQITFENLKEPKQSFSIKHESNTFELFKYPQMKTVKSFDTLQVKKFMLEFRRKNFSKFTEDVPMEYQDSIRKSAPMYVFNIKLKTGEEQVFKAYNKPGWGRVDYNGYPLQTDPDHFFMVLNNNDFVYAQYFTFDPVIKELKDFINKE